MKIGCASEQNQRYQLEYQLQSPLHASPISKKDDWLPYLFTNTDDYQSYLN